ncbi:MAG: ATP-binding protein [Melioribacteraceae bacterium]|nr:ATP-binding protein [Melioribacteraceae bacterium]
MELVLKINELVQRINSTLPEIEIKVHSDDAEKAPLSAVEMLNLFRITQEAIQNAVKHAEAPEINVELNSQKSTVNLIISDNGKGFNLAEVKAGNGLESMQKRCEDCGGDFDITSSETGTKVKCEIKY